MTDVANQNGTPTLVVPEPDNGLAPGHYDIHFWHNLADEAQIGVYARPSGRLVGFVHNPERPESTWFKTEQDAMLALSAGAPIR